MTHKTIYHILLVPLLFHHYRNDREILKNNFHKTVRYTYYFDNKIYIVHNADIYPNILDF